MTETQALLLIGYLAQAALTVVLSVVLLYFHRQYRRSYLLQWSRSWLAQTLYLVAGVAGLWLAAHSVDARHPLRVFTALAALISGYLAPGWLLFGTYEVTRGRPVPRRRVRELLFALAGLG